MLNRLYIIIGLSLAVVLFVECNEEARKATTQSEASLPAADRDNGQIQLSEAGFGAAIVADSLGRVRHIAVRDNGDVYVKLRKLNDEGHGILALRDEDGDGRMDMQAGWGDYTGTGIDFYKDHLYASSDTSVYRYSFQGDELLPTDGTGELIVGGFINQGQHAVKPFTFDQAGNIYVNVGGPSNACQSEMRSPGSPGLDPCPQRDWQAGIWQFKAETPGQMQKIDGKAYATGIRNAVALDWSSGWNSLFAVQHGRDDLHRLWPDLYSVEDNTELPAEEFLQIDEGDDFGWPYCYYDHFQNQKLLAPEYGGDGKKQDRCEGVKPPVVAFPGQWGPNDLLFYTGDQFPERYKNGAFIAFHGSWNRRPNPQAGYCVAFVPFENGKPSGDFELFAQGFPKNDSFTSPSEANHRPMGLAQGPDGSLYITDSVHGRVWRVMYYGTPNS
jgi:glucose/arabinose dehydrogenase